MITSTLKRFASILAGICVCTVFAQLPVSAATLVYYDGTNNGTSVTNLGTLGAAGNGTLTTAGTGSVTFQTTGGPTGVGDSFVSVASTASNGGWVTVPAANLNNFQNTSWSVTGAFNRTATTNSIDISLHFGGGDGSGGESELYITSPSGGTGTRLEHFPGPDVGTTSVSLATGAWHTYAITFQASGLNDGTGVLSFYLNGNLAGTDNTFTLAGMTQTLQWGGIGYAANTGTADRAFTGGIDNFAFYNTWVSPADITLISNGTLNPLAVVPEPGRAMLLLCAGLACLLGRRRTWAR